MTDDLIALQLLLEALADPACDELHWRYRCNLGAAGYVRITLDLRPAALTETERDTILSTVARLVNWSHE